MWPFRKKTAAVQVAAKGRAADQAIASHVVAEDSETADLVDAMLTDYQTKLALGVINSNAKQATVTVTADDGGPRAELMAEYLTALYSRKQSAMLECVPYGRVAFEKAWDYAAGFTFPETLNELPFRNTRMRLTQDGNFDGIELDSASKKNAVILEPAKSWWLALDPKPTEPHGKSRLRGAPQQLWRDKKEIRKLLHTFIGRFVLGIGIAHGPMQFQNPLGPEHPPIDAAAWFNAQLNQVRSGGGLYLSNERVTNPDGSVGDYAMDAKMMEFAVRDGRPILDIIDHLDSCQLLAFGIPPKTVMEGDSVGSFALVSQQMLLLLSMVEDVVSQIVESYQRYVVDKAAALNDPGWSLTVNFTPLTQRPDDLATELVKNWLTTAQLSPLIQSGVVDVGPILESVGVTPSPDALARLQGMVNAQADQVRAREPVMLNASFLPRLR